MVQIIPAQRKPMRNKRLQLAIDTSLSANFTIPPTRNLPTRFARRPRSRGQCSLDRLGFREHPGAIGDFLARSIPARHVVPPRRRRETVGRVRQTPAELHGDRSVGVRLRRQTVSPSFAFGYRVSRFMRTTSCWSTGVGWRLCLNCPNPPCFMVPWKYISDSARANVFAVTETGG
jgi:hypothetical protein